MNNVYVRDAVESDVAALLRLGLRERDKTEALNIRGGDDEGMALYDSYVLSRTCRTVIINEVVVAMFGVVPHSIYSSDGSVWFLASDQVDEERKAFARISKNEVNAMCEKYSRLTNFVDADNKKSIRWLKWLGFTVDPNAAPSGPHRHLFHKFERLGCV